MNNLRRNFERFCYRHQDKGIRNLMLYIAIGTAIVYLIGTLDPSGAFYSALVFDRDAILHGQVWRIITYIFIPRDTSIIGLAVNLYFDYVFGKMIERTWGAFRFNLFYFSGVLITALGALLLGLNASILYIDLSLTLAFATVFPEAQILFMYIIPLKMKYLAWLYFGVTIFQIIQIPFPRNLLPVFALLNYFLFFGSDVLHVLPDFLRGKKKGIHYTQRKQRTSANWTNGYKKSDAPAYRHKCTVCGRTDTENPGLEFRYCSKCSGYYCYCIDHINDHAHIQ